MKTLVFLEHQGPSLTRGSPGCWPKRPRLDGGRSQPSWPAAGDLEGLAAEAGQFGAAKVYLARDEALDPPLPQPRVDVLERIADRGGYDTFLFSNSVLGADVAAGLAARLDAGLNWDLVDLVVSGGQLIGKRLALQDSVLIDVGLAGRRRVALFRPGSFEPVPGGEASRRSRRCRSSSGRIRWRPRSPAGGFRKREKVLRSRTPT